MIIKPYDSFMNNRGELVVVINKKPNTYEVSIFVWNEAEEDYIWERDEVYTEQDIENLINDKELAVII